MFLVNIIVFALATVARAAPVVEQGLNSIKWTPEHILQPGEVILFGEGRSKYPWEKNGIWYSRKRAN